MLCRIRLESELIGSPYVACDNWHTWAVQTINRLSPSMLIVSQDSYILGAGVQGVHHRCSGRADSRSLFGEIRIPHTEKIFLGNIPLLSQSGPSCLSTHLDDAQACSNPSLKRTDVLIRAEFSSAAALHIRYIDPTPWFCSNVCTAVVGPYNVYMDRFHVTATYATYLHNALAHAIFSPVPMPTHFHVNISAAVGPPSKGPVSGRYLLLGGAALGNTPVVKVEFRLSGNGLHNVLICSGTKSPYGWGCGWDTSQVPNGRYTVRSIGYGAAGTSVRSKPISFSVKN